MEIRVLIALLFHTSVCCTYCAAIVAFIFKPLWEQLGKLTVWDMWIQFIFFGFSALVDICNLLHFDFRKFVYLRDRVFSSLTVPLAQFVFLMYWGLLVTMRKIKNPDSRVSHTWLNHVSHTMILPVIFIDMKLLKHRYPRRSDGLTVSTLFGVIYLYMVVYQGYVVGHYPYFILDGLNIGYRTLFFVGCIGLICIFYLIGERINFCIWGKEEQKLIEIQQPSVCETKEPQHLSTSLCLEMSEVTTETDVKDSGVSVLIHSSKHSINTDVKDSHVTT